MRKRKKTMEEVAGEEEARRAERREMVAWRR